MHAVVSPGTVERTRLLVGISLLAAVLWLVVATWARSMDAMPGTMGLGLAMFVVMWSLMMAAMMLPSSMPLAALYARTVTIHRQRRLVLFGAGYLLAWALTGLPVFGLAWVAGRLAGNNPGWATAAASAIFAIVGLYQLTPLKDRCLHHCRSPLSHLFRYASYRGRLRDLRAGLHHGMYCLGCCWGLMSLMVAFGVMNLWAMVALAAVIALEKQWTHGAAVARLTGVAALALALLVPFVPELAPGLHAARDTVMDGMPGM
jgi:predicted metal-binding membrane protein